MDTRKTNVVGQCGWTRSFKGVHRSSTAGLANRLNHARFQKMRLPTPISVLRHLGITPGSANHAGYLLVNCPFHKSGKEEHASFAVHRIKGNFRCFTCGVHGGDVLALWMQHTGKTFKQAACELGAWGAKL